MRVLLPSEEQLKVKLEVMQSGIDEICCLRHSIRNCMAIRSVHLTDYKNMLSQLLRHLLRNIH